jgi:hypothetical protein
MYLLLVGVVVAKT